MHCFSGRFVFMQVVSPGVDSLIVHLSPLHHCTNIFRYCHCVTICQSTIKPDGGLTLGCLEVNLMSLSGQLLTKPLVRRHGKWQVGESVSGHSNVCKKLSEPPCLSDLFINSKYKMDITLNWGFKGFTLLAKSLE